MLSVVTECLVRIYNVVCVCVCVYGRAHARGWVVVMVVVVVVVVMAVGSGGGGWTGGAHQADSTLRQGCHPGRFHL